MKMRILILILISILMIIIIIIIIIIIHSSKAQRSNKKRFGFSRRSFTRTRKVTASLPSIKR